jgi:hypothetical protein
MEKNIENSAYKILIEELLDVMTNDSENFERTMKLFTDDCVWVMESGGTEYHGIIEIKTFVKTAMSLRTHDKDKNTTEVTNCFSSGENVCIEYSHGMIGTESITRMLTTGFKGKIPKGITRYCMTYHIRDGKFDRVHEYINTTSWWLNFLLPIGMSYLHRTTMKKIAKNKNLSNAF